jgi:hypothetical protein
MLFACGLRPPPPFRPDMQAWYSQVWATGLLLAMAILSGPLAEVAWSEIAEFPPSAADERYFLDAPPTPDSGCPHACWTWKLLPEGLLYRSYLAGVKEPRISGTLVYETDAGWLLDVTLGGRAGLARYGTSNTDWPEGWQVDIEGAAFPRMNLEEDWDMDAADFRFGVPLTYAVGQVQTKFAYYHLSSHLGDERILRVPAAADSRINYSRDAVVLGVSYFLDPSWRVYAESGWSFATGMRTEPWEFQLGVEFSPPCRGCLEGAPFLAINGHLREEVDFGGQLVLQTGWQWRGRSGHRLRTGLHYLNGKSNQFEFVDESEQQIGLGAWYDY